MNAVQQVWDRASSGIWIYLTVLTIVYLFYHLKDFLRSVKLAFKLNGPAALPIIGNTAAIINGSAMHRMATEDYGPLFRLWVTVLPYVIVLEPKDVQLILCNSKHMQKTHLYTFFDNFVGKGLATLDADTWRVHRKLVQPVFHRQYLEKFLSAFASSAERLTNKFLMANDRVINITSFVNDTVYEVLCETVLGIRNTEIDTPKIADELKTFRQHQIMAHYRISYPWLMINSIYRWTKAGRQEEKQKKDLFNTCLKLLERKRQMLRNSNETSENRKAKGSRSGCVLEYLVELNEKNPSFSDKNIIEECATFMLTGQDSVSTATAISLFLLAKHTDWQEKCRAELEEIFGDDERTPTMTDLNEMKNLEMCIKETLRLYPSVPIFARILAEDIKIDNHVLPAGCNVAFIPFMTHRLPQHFPNPHEFMPERFEPQISGKRHPYAYIPFSVGQRNCIGYKFAMLEMKCIISTILRKCNLLTVPGKDELRVKFRITLRAQGGLHVKIQTRNKTNNVSSYNR